MTPRTISWLRPCFIYDLFIYLFMMVAVDRCWTTVTVQLCIQCDCNLFIHCRIPAFASACCFLEKILSSSLMSVHVKFIYCDVHYVYTHNV